MYSILDRITCLAFLVPWLSLSLGGLLFVGGADVKGQESVAVSNEHASKAVVRGVDWLLQQQATDHGWHSETYGMMKGGVGTTGLILSALSLGPNTEKVKRSMEGGAGFLTANRDRNGLVCGIDGVADFPVYGTALLLTACGRQPELKRSIPVEELCQSLINLQRTSGQGWSLDDLDYGGWGIASGDQIPVADDPSNLAVTTCVLEALSTLKRVTPEIRDAAIVFLERCQNDKSAGPDDGGFVYTAHYDDPLNKAGQFRDERGAIRAHSYRTTTCDGISSLRFCGVTTKDSRLNAAEEWLKRSLRETSEVKPENLATDRTPGSKLDYYESASLARVLSATDEPEIQSHAPLLLRRLLDRQRPDGSWSNPDQRMREDDPLIATALAITALVRLQVSVE